MHVIDGVSREIAADAVAMAIRFNQATGLSPNSLLIRRAGQESAIEDTATPIHDTTGAVIGAVIVFRDVSVARAMSVEMAYLAQHEFLTDLPNRMLLNDRLGMTHRPTWPEFCNTIYASSAGAITLR